MRRVHSEPRPSSSWWRRNPPKGKRRWSQLADTAAVTSGKYADRRRDGIGVIPAALLGARTECGALEGDEAMLDTQIRVGTMVVGTGAAPVVCDISIRDGWISLDALNRCHLVHDSQASPGVHLRDGQFRCSTRCKGNAILSDSNSIELNQIQLDLCGATDGNAG